MRITYNDKIYKQIAVNPNSSNTNLNCVDNTRTSCADDNLFLLVKKFL